MVASASPRLLPEVLDLALRERLELAPVEPRQGFEALEPLGEAAVDDAELLLRVEALAAGVGDEREETLADTLAGVDRRAHLHALDALEEPLRHEERRQRRRDAGDDRLRLGGFLTFQLLPARDVIRALVRLVAEDVRMPAHELLGEPARDRLEIEGARLGGDLRVQEHLEE